MKEQIIRFEEIYINDKVGSKNYHPITEAKIVGDLIRCKDCKHYLRNKMYVIDWMPLMGNQLCEKWGDGCRTDENGFCFLGERKEEEQ